MKKAFWVLTGLVSVALMLVGCSGNTDGSDISGKENYGFNQTGYPIVSKPITLRAVVRKNVLHDDWGKTYWAEWAEKKSGIKIEYEHIDKQSWDQKKQIMFAANELPDIFMGGFNGITQVEEVVYGDNNGMLIPLNDLIEKYAPNIKETYQKYPFVKAGTTTPSGNIYSLPKLSFAVNNVKRIWINQQWLNNLGMEKPETVEQMREVLFAFRDKDPDKNGINDTYGTSGCFLEYEADMRFLWLRAYGFLTDSFNIKNGNIVYTPYEVNFKEYLAEMNYLFKEGLIDKSYFTQSPTDFKAKSSLVKVGVASWSSPSASGGMTEKSQTEQYTYVKPLTSKVNSTPIWDKAYSSSVTGGNFVITEVNKYPEASIRWADMWFTEEGGIVKDIGPEKGSFGKDTEVGYYFLDDGTYKVKYPDDVKDTWAYYNANFAPAADGCNFGLQPKMMELGNGRNQGLLYELGMAMLDYGKNSPVTQMPNFYFDKESQEKLAVIKTEVESYARQMEAKFITGDEPLSNFEKYRETLRKYGVEKLIDTYQEAYKEYVKNLEN